MPNKRVLLITGGTSGIGYETAKLFGKSGYSVGFNGTNREAGERILDELKKMGIDAEFFHGDVTDENVVNGIVRDCVQRFGRLDVLVNNAGALVGRKRLDEMTAEFWDRVMDLNLKSVFFCSRAAVSHLKKSGDASIINVTSIAAYNGGGPGATAYAAAKGAIVSFTRGLAKELIPFGIRVNAVSPGTIDTPFHCHSTNEMMEAVRQSIPAKRLGIPSEVASAIYFLASEHASYLVGEIIQINGGQMMV